VLNSDFREDSTCHISRFTQFFNIICDRQSRVRSVGIVNRLRYRRQSNSALIPGSDKKFFSNSKNPDRLWGLSRPALGPIQTGSGAYPVGSGAYPVSCSMGRGGCFPGYRGTDMKLNTYFHLLQWKRMTEPIPALPNTLLRLALTTSSTPFAYNFSLHMVNWSTRWLQAGRSLVRFLMVSIKFFIDIILPAASWPWG